MGKGEAITAGQEVGVMVADQMGKGKVGRMDMEEVGEVSKAIKEEEADLRVVMAANLTEGDTTVNREDTIVNQEDMATDQRVDTIVNQEDMATDQKVDTIVNQEDMATDQKVDTTAGLAMVNQGRMDMVAAEEASKATKVAEEVFRIEEEAGEEVSNVRTLAPGVLALQQVLQGEPLGHPDMTGRPLGAM